MSIKSRTPEFRPELKDHIIVKHKGQWEGEKAEGGRGEMGEALYLQKCKTENDNNNNTICFYLVTSSSTMRFLLSHVYFCLYKTNTDYFPNTY